MKKKKRTDAERIDWIENKVNVKEEPFIAWPEKDPPIPGYYVSSREKNVRACIDTLISRDEEAWSMAFRRIVRRKK